MQEGERREQDLLTRRREKGAEFACVKEREGAWFACGIRSKEAEREGQSEQGEAERQRQREGK